MNPDTSHAASASLIPPPSHVGIIMDGNGRWAQARGLPRLAGHEGGVENVRGTIKTAVEMGIQCLTLYAFSTENWNRPPEEVKGLLGLIDASSAARGWRAQSTGRPAPSSRQPGAAGVFHPARRSGGRRPNTLQSKADRQYRFQLWRPGRAGAGGAAGLSPGGSILRTSRKRSSPAIYPPPDSRIRTSSSAPAARCDCPTSCSGNPPMPSSMPRMSSGRISAARLFWRPSRATPPGSGASAGFPAPHPGPRRPDPRNPPALPADDLQVSIHPGLT